MRHQNSRNYEEIQKQHWHDFNQQLNYLKDKKLGLSINYDEIAKGLGISRQRLSQFVNNPTLGLPIERSSILKLWDYLTASEELNAKKDLSRAAYDNRMKLRLEKPQVLDDLLKSAGFLPTSRTIDTINPQIERVKHRLGSFWIANSHALSHITDSIIDTILDHGGFDRGNQKQSEEGYSADEARKWLVNNVPILDSDTALGFEREINRFENSGKMKFCDEELFELYQSILENNIFKDFDIRMRVTDCQFKTISFSLIDAFEESDTKSKVSQLSIQGERKLRPTSQQNIEIELNKERFLRFSPVIQATVNVNLKNRKEGETLAFSYISSTTHVGNMLVALSNGLGYVSSVLEMTSFFIRAIGRKRESLARISITLTDKSNQSYHGLWIEQNTIVGILQAFSFAVMLWLSERLSDKDIELFYDICRKLSNVNDNLYEGINNVYNHSFNYGKYGDSSESTIENQLNEKVIQVIENLSKQIERLSRASLNSPTTQRVSREYFENCKANLDKKTLLAKLSLAHAALVKSKTGEASRLLDSIRNDLFVYSGGIQSDISGDFTPLQVLYESETMFFKLLSGDQDFIEKKEWRNSLTPLLNLEEVFEKLCHYVTDRNFGIIDIDVYLAVSQFSGICGLADFYTCRKEDMEYLKKAADILISSACYSARIGQKHRAARALCHSIRVLCRLGNRDQETISFLIRAVERILSEDLTKHPASKAQFELAKGEYLLQFKLESDKNSWQRALGYFLSSWFESYNKFEDGNNPFLRTKADSLYNIYRLLKQIKKAKLFDSNLIKSLRHELVEDEKTLRSLFIQLKIDEENSTYDLFEEKLQDEVIRIWNSWCFGKNHPFAEMIREGSFLENCN